MMQPPMQSFPGQGQRQPIPDIGGTFLHQITTGEPQERLRQAAMSGGNTFDALMDAVRVCSLGQISQAFFEVGGQYRRNV